MIRNDIAYISVDLKKHAKNLYYCERNKKYFLLNVNEETNSLKSNIVVFNNEDDLKNTVIWKDKNHKWMIINDWIYNDDNYSYRIRFCTKIWDKISYCINITRLLEKNLVNKFISQFLAKWSYFVWHTPLIESSLFQTEYFNDFDISLISLNDLWNFDKIVLDMPVWLDSVSIRWMSFRKLDYINFLVQHLNKNWLLFVWLIEKEIKQLEKILPNRILWFIEAPKWLMEYTALRPIITIISKDEKKNNEIFVASFEDWTSYEELYNNFINWVDTKSVKEWLKMSIDDFRWFNALKVNEEIEKLKSQYKEFDNIKFEEIISEIKNKATEEDENDSLYISKCWGKTFFQSYNDLKSPDNYYQIKLKNDKVSKTFLLNYFKTDIWQLSLETCMDWSFRLKINKEYLLNLDIPYLKSDMQKKLWEAYDKLANLKEMIGNIEKELSLNPKNIDIILWNLDEKTVKHLSESDEIRALIRQWEWDKLEFKKTFSRAVEKPAPVAEIRKESLKNIAWFMNKFWWTLLIWVADDWSIYWIENDEYKTNDDYLKRFKDVVKTAFTTTNVLDMLNYGIIEIDWKKIFRVDCPMSRDLVYLEKEQDWAYVRNSPSVDKKMWKDLVDYTKTHAEEYDSIHE